MARRIILLAAIFFATAAHVAHAKEPVKIPLKDIWGYFMPGTRDVRDLQEDVKSSVERKKNPLWSRISSALHASNEKAKRGFVVEGVDADALREAYEVFGNNREPQGKFPKDAKLSLVFFTTESGYYVHLTDVSVEGSTILIHYKFVPHFTANTTVHFALIPLSTLGPGDFEVKIVQDPTDTTEVTDKYPAIPAENVEKIICKPFSFRVE